MFRHSSYFTCEQIAEFRNFLAENKQNTELITSRLMLAMGFKMHLCGAMYLREAIVTRYKLPADKKISLSKTVYAEVAKKYNSNTNNVTRDIRTAVQNCYENGNMQVINAICGYDIVFPNYPPRNNELISGIVSWLRLIEMEYGNSR